MCASCQAPLSSHPRRQPIGRTDDKIADEAARREMPLDVAVIGMVCLSCVTLLAQKVLARSTQRLEARNHVEQFFFDAALTQTMEGAVKLDQ